KDSVSLEAVPLPIAMASILYAFTIERIFFIDGVTSRCGGCGKIVSLYNNCPFSSKQTTLQPDLNPGSIANIRFSPNGAANNNCVKFAEKTSIDCLSALSLASVKTSFSKLGASNRLYASAVANRICSAVSIAEFLICL